MTQPEIIAAIKALTKVVKTCRNSVTFSDATREANQKLIELIPLINKK